MGKRMNNITIYPRHSKMMDILVALNVNGVASYVRNITVIAETLMQHEYGYNWAWEDLQIWGEFDFNERDVDLIEAINNAHWHDVLLNGDFVTSGDYRTVLSKILKRLPNLKTITIRNLTPGEHIPGWVGNKLFKQLSFYEEGLDTNAIFYGDWQYDRHYRRITQYVDEYGELIIEPHAGPQASFIDDFKAAVRNSNTEARAVSLFHGVSQAVTVGEASDDTESEESGEESGEEIGEVTQKAGEKHEAGQKEVTVT